jgi:hypothetical protein
MLQQLNSEVLSEVITHTIRQKFVGLVAMRNENHQIAEC